MRGECEQSSVMAWRLLGLRLRAVHQYFIYTTCNLRETTVFCRARSTGERYSARPGASRAATAARRCVTMPAPARPSGPGRPTFINSLPGTVRYNTGQPEDGARPAVVAPLRSAARSVLCTENAPTTSRAGRRNVFLYSSVVRLIDVGARQLR